MGVVWAWDEAGVRSKSKLFFPSPTQSQYAQSQMHTHTHIFFFFLGVSSRPFAEAVIGAAHLDRLPMSAQVTCATGFPVPGLPRVLPGDLKSHVDWVESWG